MLWITSSSDELEALDELFAADDRAAAIVGASFLDTRIDAAIRAELIDDEKGELLDKLLREGAPIGSFAPKISLGFALGMYGPEAKRDLVNINKNPQRVRSRDDHQELRDGEGGRQTAMPQPEAH